MTAASCTGPETSLEALSMVFTDQRVGAVVVVNAARVPLGIVTPRDLAAANDAALDDDGGPLDTELGLRAVPAERRAGDIMMPLVFTVHTQTPVLVASRLMVVEGVTHLPVVDRKRAVVGMISALDLVRHVMTRVAPM
jgi:CBS domain-containing protein